MPFDRQAISKRTRFDIFKRDGFKCQYCGAAPPDVLLELDHLKPVASGGGNELENLITSCFDCNRGKADGTLTSVPPSTNERAQAVAEKLAQLKSYNALLRKQAKATDKSIDAVELIFQGSFPDWSFNDSFRVSVRRNFLSKLAEHEVCDAMALACARGLDRDRTIKYFCGVCWNLIRR